MTSAKVLVQILGALETGNEQLATIISQQSALILLLTPPPPATMLLSITSTNEQGETTTMATKASRGKMKLDIHGDGTATASVTFQDNTGLSASLPVGATLVNPFASSDPGIVVTPAADGMSAKLAPSTPPVLVTGAIITAGPATITNADGTTIDIAAVDSKWRSSQRGSRWPCWHEDCRCLACCKCAKLAATSPQTTQYDRISSECGHSREPVVLKGRTGSLLFQPATLRSA